MRERGGEGGSQREALPLVCVTCLRSLSELETLSCSCPLSEVIWPHSPGWAASDTQHYYQSSLSGL